MKRIAISLKKEYWNEILRGEKQIEFRKYSPVETETEPFLAIVHVSGTYAWQGVIFFFGAEKNGDQIKLLCAGASRKSCNRCRLAAYRPAP